MPNTKRTVDEPEIRELLSGLVRSDRHYYRLDPTTGFHTAVPARAELLKLVSQVTATRLLREAVAANLITEKEDIDLAEESHGRAAEKEANVTDDDSEAEPDEEHVSPHHLRQRERARERFQLVKTSSRHGVYWGIYNAETHQQELISPDKREALQEIARRIAAEDMDHIPYHLQFRSGLAA